MHSVVKVPSMGATRCGEASSVRYHSFSAVVVATDVNCVCSATVDMEVKEEEEESDPSSSSQEKEQDSR